MQTVFIGDQERHFTDQHQICSSLTLFDMRGHVGPPEMCLTTVLKCLGGGS